MRKFIAVVMVLGLVGGGGAWFWAGRQAGPFIEIQQPDRFIGQVTSLELMVESPDGQFTDVDVTLEQGDWSLEVFSLARPTQGEVRQETAEQIYII